MSTKREVQADALAGFGSWGLKAQSAGLGLARGVVAGAAAARGRSKGRTDPTSSRRRHLPSDEQLRPPQVSLVILLPLLLSSSLASLSLFDVSAPFRPPASSRSTVVPASLPHPTTPPPSPALLRPAAGPASQDVVPDEYPQEHADQPTPAGRRQLRAFLPRFLCPPARSNALEPAARAAAAAAPPSTGHREVAPLSCVRRAGSASASLTGLVAQHGRLTFPSTASIQSHCSCDEVRRAPLL